MRWFEEPVSSDDLDGLREVRDAVLPDVTAGEYGYDLYYFAGCAPPARRDCVQADVSRCGGITEWPRVAAVAASYGLDISGHRGPHLHAHAAAPDLRHLEWFHDHARIESMFFDGTLGPLPPEYSTEWLTCAIASRHDAVVVGWPGAAHDAECRRANYSAGLSGVPRRPADSPRCWCSGTRTRCCAATLAACDTSRPTGCGLPRWRDSFPAGAGRRSFP